MNTKLIDLHNDLLTGGGDFQEYNNAEKSGYKSIYALYKGERSLNDISEIYSCAYSNGVRNFAFEDGCYTESSEFEKLMEKVIPLYVSPCWNYENDFCGGCKSDVGLKEKGRLFIKKLNDINIPLDLAHTNRKTFYQTIDVADNVLCSHTSFSFICDSVRNIDDNQIRIILEKDGVVGLCFVGYFLSENAKAKSQKQLESAFYEAIDRYLQKFGVKGLCIGSDFFGTDLLAFGSYDYFYNSFCDHFSANYSTDVLNAILYKNATVFFRRCTFLITF